MLTIFTESLGGNTIQGGGKGDVNRATEPAGGNESGFWEGTVDVKLFRIKMMLLFEI